MKSIHHSIRMDKNGLCLDGNLLVILYLLRYDYMLSKQL